MNFLFVTPKYASRGDFYNFNLGLAYVSSYMKHKGFNVSYLNCNHCDEPVEQQLSECIVDEKIDVVCTGGMAIDFYSINEILDKTKSIKPEIITVAGGAIISSDPKLALENMQIDFGVIGEGEETMAELAAALCNGRDVSNIRGLTFFDTKNNLIRTGPRDPIVDLDALPFPDYEGFDYGYHLSTYTPNCHLYYHTILDEVRPGKIITSRSCPFNCTFCYHQLGKKYRQRSLDNVFKEIDYLVEKYDINTLILFDEVFAIDKARIYEFAKRIKKYELKWMPILRVDTIDKDVLGALKESGVYLIGYGIENVNEEILRSMQKKITKVQIEQTLELTKEAQIGIQAGILFGDPAETEETVKESIEWWLKHLNYGLLLGMIITLPDSPLYRYTIAKGLIEDKLQYIKDRFPLINLTKLSDDKFKELNDFVCNYMNDEKYIIVGEVLSSKEESNNPLWKSFLRLPKYYNQKSFTIKVKCPECSRESKYKNMHHNVFSPSTQYFPILCRNCYMLLWIRTKEAFFENYRFYNKIIIKTIKIKALLVNRGYHIFKFIYSKIWKIYNKEQYQTT